MLSREAADVLVNKVIRLPYARRTAEENGAWTYWALYGYMNKLAGLQGNGELEKAAVSLETRIEHMFFQVCSRLDNIVEYNTELYEYRVHVADIVGIPDSNRQRIASAIGCLDHVGSARVDRGNVIAFPSGDATEANGQVLRRIVDIVRAHMPNFALPELVVQ